MRRLTVLRLILPLLLVFTATAYGIELEPTLQAGLRTFADTPITHTYSQGMVYYPSLTLRFDQMKGIGIGYDGGYKKHHPMGVSNQSSTLQADGLELFSSFRFKSGKFNPFVRLGLGLYRVEQDFDAEELKGLEFDKTKLGLLGGCGISYFASPRFFLSIETKFVLLNVKRSDRNVNLGGFRFFFGFGYVIKLNRGQ